MESALSNPLVLAHIAEFLPYDDLKNARAVNRLWAESVKLVFKKRAIYNLSCLSYYDKCSPLLLSNSPTTNQEIAANVNWQVVVATKSDSDVKLFYREVAASAPWLAKISKLYLVDFETAQLNRLLPFLLDRLPGLEKLYLRAVKFDDQDTEMPAELASLDDTAVHQESPVVSLKLDFKVDGVLKTPLDPAFLKQCSNLKTFAASLEDSSSAFLQFLASWKKLKPHFMRLQNLTIHLGTWVPENQKLCEALVDFINRSQPKSLKLRGFEFLDFAAKDQDEHVKGTSNQWTLAASEALEEARLESLTISFPIEEDGETEDSEGPTWFPEYALSRLKQCRAFSKVTKLCLEASAMIKSGCHWVKPSPAVTGRVAHAFDQVTTLTLKEGPRTRHRYELHGIVIRGVIKPEYCHDALDQLINASDLGAWFKKIVPHFPAVTHLTVASIVLTKWDDFDEFFDTLKQMRALRQLSLFVSNRSSRSNVRDREGFIWCTQRGRYLKEGFWRNLGVLTGLSKLKIKLPKQRVPQYYFVALFYGYQPHVALEVEVELEIGKYRYRKYSLQLTVDEFEKVKAAGQAYSDQNHHDPPHGRANYSQSLTESNALEKTFTMTRL